jgi:hypothetical protein
MVGRLDLITDFCTTFFSFVQNQAFKTIINASLDYTYLQNIRVMPISQSLKDTGYRISGNINTFKGAPS